MGMPQRYWLMVSINAENVDMRNSFEFARVVRLYAEEDRRNELTYEA